MSVLNTLAHAFLDGVGPIETRSWDYPSFDVQLANVWNRRHPTTSWRQPDVGEILGVPAIFSAVTLIANTVGSLSLEAYRRGTRLDTEDAPRLILRPNPFTTPRVFFRDTAFYLATRGEAWWWIARRDVDDSPLSLVPVPPWEIKVEKNDRNRLRPTIKWGDRTIPNEDIRQITYLPDRDGLRGIGPLQQCGAAATVTVEADQWAANFYSGSVPSIVGTTDQDMTSDELAEMDRQWNEKAPNLPRWLTNGLTLAESPFDAEKAQLTESRQHQVGEAARMFNIPGALLEYQMGGSSLTYQNQADIRREFQERCLSPNYLEPIEQEISDLLTRSTQARFNLKQLLRADHKTRAEVHKTYIELGVYGPEVAARDEGYEPGNADYAPVPFSAHQAVPTILPPDMPIRSQSEAKEVRCPAGHLLAELASPPYRFTCFRCKRQVAA